MGQGFIAARQPFACCSVPWQCLYLRPEPQGQGSLRPTLRLPPAPTATPNAAALRLLPAQLRENPVLYPPPETLARGEFNLRGLQNKNLRAHLGKKTSGQVSRLLKRLRLHGLVKKVGHTYRYYLTLLGKQVIASGLKLKNGKT